MIFLLLVIYDVRFSHILLFYDVIYVIFPFRSHFSEIAFLSQHRDFPLLNRCMKQRSREARDCQHIRDVINLLRAILYMTFLLIDNARSIKSRRRERKP